MGILFSYLSSSKPGFVVDLLPPDADDFVSLLVLLLGRTSFLGSFSYQFYFFWSSFPRPLNFPLLDEHFSKVSPKVRQQIRNVAILESNWCAFVVHLAGQKWIRMYG